MSFQAYIDNIKSKIGKRPEDLEKLAEKRGLLKRGVKTMEIVDWLKKDNGLGHGHAMAIYATFSIRGFLVLARLSPWMSSITLMGVNGHARAPAGSPGAFRCR